jgi:hypothetical protein
LKLVLTKSCIPMGKWRFIGNFWRDEVQIYYYINYVLPRINWSFGSIYLCFYLQCFKSWLNMCMCVFKPIMEIVGDKGQYHFEQFKQLNLWNVFWLISWRIQLIYLTEK